MTFLKAGGPDPAKWRRWSVKVVIDGTSYRADDPTSDAALENVLKRVDIPHPTSIFNSDVMRFRAERLRADGVLPSLGEILPAVNKFLDRQEPGKEAK